MSVPQSSRTAPQGAAEDLRRHVLRLLQEQHPEQRSSILVFPQVLLEFLDYDHKMALFLNKLLYWTERTRNPEKWIYKTYQDWFDELGFKESVVRRLIHGDAKTRTPKRTLKDIGVEVRVRRAPNGSPTCHYRIHLDILLGEIQKFSAAKQADSVSPESRKFPGCNPGNPQDGSCGSPAQDPADSRQTLDHQTTTLNSAEENSAESLCANAHSSDDVMLFSPYQKRFGKLRTTHTRLLEFQLNRLGPKRAGEVLERCVTRGRSWNYVCRALANEADAVPEAPTTLNSGELSGYFGEHGRVLDGDVLAAVPKTSRATSAWAGSARKVQSAEQVWGAAAQQLAAQLGSATAHTLLRHAELVDYDAELQTFLVVVQDNYARDLLSERLARTVQRILKDVCGQPAQAQFLTPQDWSALQADQQIACAKTAG